MATIKDPKKIYLLVLNPNSSEDMTQGMKQAIRSMDLPDHLEIRFYTAPHIQADPAWNILNSPASINNDADIAASVDAVWLDDVRHSLATRYDGVLVACYSSHPLVPRLAAAYPELAVTGIFEASVLATLPLLRRHPVSGAVGAWGIVTTGAFWESHLHEAVQLFLGQQRGTAISNFFGVFTTGLNAGDFHGNGGVSPETVAAKLKDAIRSLLAIGDVDCVVMGCAGMAGLEEIIRETVVEEYGADRAKGVYVVDGVRAGVGVLEGMVRSRRMFLPQ